MEIFIINLERKKEKKEYMIKQLSKTKFKYTFFKAIDGLCLDNNFNVINEWRDPYTQKNITNGEIGCALSHYNIWKKIVDNNIKKAIIIEDDVIIPYNFDKVINECHNKIEYDLLYLGRKIINSEEKIINDTFVKPNYSYWTCAYILTLSGAKKLIESDFINNILPVDEFLSIMYNSFPYEEFKKYFENKEKLNVLSLKDLLIFPNENAFFDSDTYNSLPNNTKEIKFIENNINKNFLVISCATNETDGYNRFIKYCKIYGYKYKILGLGKKWIGGDMKNGKGGGQKILELFDELNSWKNINNKLENTLILFCDSYDVILIGSPFEIINKYKLFKNKIVFSAEKYCWPNSNLKKLYPLVDSNFKYLNSGGYIGWANDILKIISNFNGLPNDDDQEFFTKEFLNNDNIILDYNCEIFQTLGGINNELDINYKESRIHNIIFNTKPNLLHGNGAEKVKLYLNQLENYTGNGWNLFYHSYLDKSNINKIINKKIFVALFTKEKYNFKQDYLKFNIKYFSCYKQSINEFIKSDCDYYFQIQQDYNINEKALIDCLLADKNICAPLLLKKNKSWSNFWGEINNDGYYKRSFDYFDIIQGNKKGCWNVPYITGVILIKRNIILQYPNCFDNYNNYDNNIDIDMVFCERMRNNGVFMYVINYQNYGYIEKKEINILDYFDYHEKWEEKYINQNYFKTIARNNFEIVCQDAFNFPLFTESFCKEIIDLCELNSNWSPGLNNHNDKRLGKNGYENVPTQDIHLNQINFHDIWDSIVHKYIAPVAKVLYSSYVTKKTNISFVVKYSIDGQKDLSPHHDSSTYTINITLNNDFEGGGCRFIRQNIDLVNKDIGVATIHPGKLTHYHQGIPITKGKRYILVSFID